MPKKASIKYRSLRSNLVHLPLCLYASLAQKQVRPQSLTLYLSPLIGLTPSSSSKRPQPAFMGWSGLAAASSLAGGLAGIGREDAVETVEVDPEVAMSLGWAEGTIASRNFYYTQSDEGKVGEQHASFLENHLLSQLRAAQQGQVLNVWVMGRTKLCIRVDETDPTTKDTSAVLVWSETEIFVAPRRRGTKLESPAKAEKLNIPAYNATAEKSEKKAKKRQIEMRLLPPRVAAKWGLPVLPQDDLDKVGSDSVAGEGMIHVEFIMVREAARDAEHNEKDGIGRAETIENNRKEDEGLETWLGAWDEMPEGCAAFLGRAPDVWQDGTVVRVTASPRKGRLKSNKAKGPMSFELDPLSRTLAGVGALVNDAADYLRRAYALDESRPLLIAGPKGSGKTSLSKLLAELLESDREILLSVSICQDYGVGLNPTSDVCYQDVGRIELDARVSHTKEKMTAWVEEATRRRPCLLILDALDTLLSPEHELTPSSNPAALANHFCHLFSAVHLPLGILVIVTASSSQTLHPLLAAKHIFGETMKINLPNKEIRKEILQAMVNEQRQSSTPPHAKEHSPELDYVTLAGMSEGYTASDISDLVEGAMQQAIIHSGEAKDSRIELSMEDFVTAQAAFTPFNLRGVTLQKSNVQWSDIGGLYEPRRVLRETLEWPTKYAQIFANCPLRLRSGLLLYGFPGCGKTLLASAVAKECGLNFISVKGPEILNKYIGASEKAVRDLFERATAAKPCVLFFDEFESIAAKRGHDSTGVTDRVVNQMLTEMDGAQGLEGVYVLAATSRPDLIDPALLRPGRLDKALLCDMPSQADRLEILQAVSRRITLHPSVDLFDIAAESEGYSGADLQAVIYNAHLEVVHATIATTIDENGGKNTIKKGKGKGVAVEHGLPQKPRMNHKQVAPAEDKSPEASQADTTAMTKRIDRIMENASGSSDGSSIKLREEAPKPVVEQIHLLRSLANTRPSVTLNDRARLSRIYRSFTSDRDGNMANGDQGRQTGTRVSLM
ncbi:MAG: Peroxisome biosynthesis protein pex1 [Tremellales sp. Tagirdzhanova-0007]|nr:MAG: Peroxisome biosynthesis protein pex1 [Tremellales sp. Tagirdzhanova-0007]